MTLRSWVHWGNIHSSLWWFRVVWTHDNTYNYHVKPSFIYNSYGNVFVCEFVIQGLLKLAVYMWVCINLKNIWSRIWKNQTELLITHSLMFIVYVTDPRSLTSGHSSVKETWQVHSNLSWISLNNSMSLFNRHSLHQWLIEDFNPLKSFRD